MNTTIELLNDPINDMSRSNNKYLAYEMKKGRRGAGEEREGVREWERVRVRSGVRSEG